MLKSNLLCKPLSIGRAYLCVADPSRPIILKSIHIQVNSKSCIVTNKMILNIGLLDAGNLVWDGKGNSLILACKSPLAVNHFKVQPNHLLMILLQSMQQIQRWREGAAPIFWRKRSFPAPCALKHTHTHTHTHTHREREREII